MCGIVPPRETSENWNPVTRFLPEAYLIRFWLERVIGQLEEARLFARTATAEQLYPT